MTNTSLHGRIGRRTALGLALAVPALLVLGGQAWAAARQAVHFDEQSCLDMSSIGFVRGGVPYHWVEAPGPTSDGCPLWVAVPDA